MQVDAKDRVWSRLALWMTAKEVSRYAPSSHWQHVGMTEVPIRLLVQLSDAVEAYEQEAK